MLNLPSAESLDQNHDFPGPFMFKVIGKVEQGFVARVVCAVREELEMPDDPPFYLRQTPNGRHVSLTIEPVVQSSQQVLAVYCRICECSGVVMLL